MITRLTLICHAPTAATRAARFPGDEEIDPARDAVPGSAEARAAVARAGRRLCGPERRARQTAARLGSAFDEDAALRDQDFGRWAGRRLAEVAAAEPDRVAAWRTDPAAAPHGGESLLAVMARVEGWMAAQAALGGRVAAVTHAAVLRAAAVTALGSGAASFWRVEAGPFSTVVLSHDGRHWTLAALTSAQRKRRTINPS